MASHVFDIEKVWASSDYSPTAVRLQPAATVLANTVQELLMPGARILDLGAGHAGLSVELEHRGFAPLPLEPVARMRAQAEQCHKQDFAWIGGTGESIEAAGNSFDAIASNFGAFLCDPAEGPPEWARVLRPGGLLAFTAWDSEGFLASMTSTMMRAAGSPPEPPHMKWGNDEWVQTQLSAHFGDITIVHAEIPWELESVEHGMALYETGSPTHAFFFEAVGPLATKVRAALRQHLEEHADPATGRINARAGYALITARKPLR